MDSLSLIMFGVFLGITSLAWLALAAGTRSWNRYRENFVVTMQSNMQQMFVFVDARRVFAYNILAVVVVPLVVWVVSGKMFFSVATGLLMLFLPKRVYRFYYLRRLFQFDQQLPDALNMIAGAMRAGASLPIAIEGMVRETEGPVSQEFSLVLREQRMGVSMDQAFENLSGRVASQDLTLVVAAARIAREVGGSLAEIFERLADTLRQKAIMEGKIRALTSQGKLQGWVVGLLPIGIMYVLYKMEPDAMSPLFTSVGGWAVLLVIGILELLGGFMIKKIVTIDI